MADRVKLWFDPEGDSLEVIFSDAPGYMRETKNDAAMQRVDKHVRVIGFSVLGVSKFQKDHLRKRNSVSKRKAGSDFITIDHSPSSGEFMTIKEHDCVVLTADLPKEGL